MELTTTYTPSRFAADNTLSNPQVSEKYKLAGNIVNAVLPQVLSHVAPGISICDLCQYGDDLINTHTSETFKSKDRGVAVPTCVSVNNIVQYSSPLLDSDYNLKPGDVVKVELGAHIDGYIATAAHTVIVNPEPSQPIQGRAADVVCATHYALEAAIQMLRPGVKSSEITRVITEIAAYYRCKPVEGTFSSPMKRFVLRAGKDIENRFPEDMIVQDLDKIDFQIEPNQVYQMNIVLTTGDGKTKAAEEKPHVFQRDVHKSYQLKMKGARVAYAEINDKYTVFPFSARALTTKQARLGLSSLIQHELITPYVPMRSSRTSDLVAQFKATILVTSEGLIRTTSSPALPFVHSQYCIPAETTAAQVLSAPSVVKVAPAKQMSQVQVEFGNRRVENEDVEME
ncbi:proliferation-associated protein 2g4-like [Lichtheimia corymbifera JMRC:FSU:9682]|uniref:Proliferation-associated protein 2g4-like n=1 Tax=Lichtheimia corymbifera JMRC:FSU:9682 TaxID=1263082 RepID=A0A068RUE4_9FUNG|nr:proliferation-associated protein 2g4-like [Lichtheimia corymbifera JMRC:FSU:9682]